MGHLILQYDNELKQFNFSFQAYRVIVISFSLLNRQIHNKKTTIKFGKSVVDEIVQLHNAQTLRMIN